MIINNHKEKRFLYIDEKGERNTKDKNKPNQFLVAGISIDEDNQKKIEELVKTAKKLILPKVEINKWELKGNHNHIFNVKDKIKKDIYNKLFSKKFTKRKWYIWNKLITKANIKYEFFGVFVDNEKFLNEFLKGKISQKKEESTILNYSYNLLMSNYFKINLWNENIDFTYIDNENKIYEANKIIDRWLNTSIIFDNIEGSQKKTILKTHNDFRTMKKNKVDIGSLEILKSTDYSSTDSLVMQFVDMQIYLMHRYLVMPNGNFLNDYEKFAKIPRLDRRELINLPMEEQKRLVFKFHIAKNLVSNITNSIVILGSSNSSVIKISDKVENRYGNLLQASMILSGEFFT